MVNKCEFLKNPSPFFDLGGFVYFTRIYRSIPSYNENLKNLLCIAVAACPSSMVNLNILKSYF